MTGFLSNGRVDDARWRRKIPPPVNEYYYYHHTSPQLFCCKGTNKHTQRIKEQTKAADDDDLYI